MIGYKLCKKLNKFFKLPVHPFNLSNNKAMSYGEWQYEKGADTLKSYEGFFDIEKDNIFEGKTVVDIGCGEAGKTLFYAKHGVERIFGVEVLGKYEEQANSLAHKLGLSDKFEFVTSDAANLPFEDNSIDIIIANDAIEHVDEPERVITECLRVLKRDGRLYMNFPPYYHPFGAHLSDAIGMPWVHMFFSERTLIDVYKDAVKDLPDGEDRIDFRISKDEKGLEYFSYINKMTVKRFKKIKNELGLNVVYYKEIPLRSFFAPLAKLPIIKEVFVKMVVCIVEKSEHVY